MSATQPSRGRSSRWLPWTAAGLLVLLFAAPAAAGTHQLLTRTDNSTDTDVPVPDLLMVTITSNNDKGGNDATATQVSIQTLDTLTAADVTAVTVYYGTLLYGTVNPGSLTGITINQPSSNCCKGGSDWTYYVSLAGSAAGKTFRLTVDSITGSDGAGLPFSTAYRNANLANTPPTATIANPADASSIGGPGPYSITGTAADSDGTVSTVDVQITRSSGTEYWNGSGWQGVAIWLGATGTTSWSYSWAWTTEMEGTPVAVTARATDNLGATGTDTNNTTVDTLAPRVNTGTYANGIGFDPAPTSGDASFTLRSQWTESNPGTPQFDYNLNNTGYTGAWSDGSAGSDSTKTYAVAVTGSDYFTGITSRHTDSPYGNGPTTTSDTGPFYVLPLTPNPPTVANNGSETSLDVTIAPNSSEGGTGMLYAIRCHDSGGTPTGFWVANVGRQCTAVSADWQTTATWGSPVVVSGLSAGTQYGFSVAAGNPKDATPTTGERSASAYGTTASATTSVVATNDVTPAAPSAVIDSCNQITVQVTFTGDDNANSTTLFERSPDGSTGWTPVSGCTSVSGASPRTCVDSTVADSSTNYYRTTFTDSDGVNGTNPSAAIGPYDTTPFCPNNDVTPAAPSAVINSCNQITVQVAFTGDDDNDSTTLFERSPNGSTGWATVSGCASVGGASPRVCVDSTVATDSINYYRTDFTDPDGVNGTDPSAAIGPYDTTPFCVPGNTTPTVTITSPADSASFTAGDTVNFTGTATDAEDGTLTANLSWTSSLQGTLGSGGSFSRSDLAVGTHVITASVTDSVGATGQDQVTITVNAPAAVNGTTAGTATAEASSCSQITVVARFTGDDDDDGYSTFTIAPSGAGCSQVYGSSPRRCIISELTPGAYTLSVSFTDPDGVTGSPVTPTGSPVTVPSCNGTDDAAPTLLVLAPVRNAVITGTDRAKIQVYDPNLSTVEWMVDSANDLDLASATQNANYDCGTNCAVYEFDIDTSGLSLGAHYFTVKAVDTQNNVARITRAFRKPTSPGDGRLLRRTFGSQLCIDCHNLKTHSSQSIDSGYGNWAIECVDCHTPHQTSNIYLMRGQIQTPNSGRRSVRFESRYGARKDTVDLPGQASFANEDAGTTGSTVDGVDGPCQVCHTRTKNPGDGKERWRNSGAGGNADNHFDDGRPTQICTVCHSHDSGFSPAGGACNACHVAPPTVGKHRLHDEVWDSTAGNLPTNYAEDVSHATPTQYGYSCAECHSNDTADHFPTEGAPYDVDVLFKGTAPANPAPAAYTPDGGSQAEDPGNNGDGWNWSNGTCSNLYCHSNANPVAGSDNKASVTVTWNQDTGTTPVTCASCHNTRAKSDSGGTTDDLSAAHGKHIQYFGETDTYTFKCDECHALTIRDNPNDPWNLTRAADFSTVAGRGKLQHVDGGKDVAFSATATVADNVDQSGGSYAGGGGSCSSTYCHSRGTSTVPASFVAPFANLNWNGGTSTCESCHGGNAGATNKMATNAHTAHMNQATYLGKNFECAQCHDLTVDLASDTSIPAAERPNHVNGARNVSINKGGTYDGAFGCSNVYCHSDGTETPGYVNPPAWNSGTTLANDCSRCHGAPGTSIHGEPRYTNVPDIPGDTRNTHPKHVTAAGDCVKCHSGTVDSSGDLLSAGSHLNQSRDVVTGGFITTYDEVDETCTNQCHGAGNPRWGGNPLVCLDCHTGTEGGVLGDGAPNAVDDQWNNAGATGPGHGTLGYGNFASTGGTFPSAYGGCDYCHDLGAAHTPTAGTNPYRLRFSATDNQLCLQCHQTGNLGIDRNSESPSTQNLNSINSTKNVDTAHYRTSVDGGKHEGTEGGKLCWDCHDPHGVPSNIRMIKSTVSKNASAYGVPGSTVTVNFTDNTTPGQSPGRFTESTNTPRRGMCQACHDPSGQGASGPTKYWRSDGTDDPDGPGGNAPVTSVHNAAALCTNCHKHNDNFKGAGGGPDCRGCHGTQSQGGRRTVDADFANGTTPNFRSHHVGNGLTMGGTFNNYDCVVCHAEGQVISTASQDCPDAPYTTCTNPTYHANQKIDLRDVDAIPVKDGSYSTFQYDKDAVALSAGAAANWNSSNSLWRAETSGCAEGADSPSTKCTPRAGKGLDRFCLTCHDSLGATQIANFRESTSQTTLNPFADTIIGNNYDQINRTRVTDIASRVVAGGSSLDAVGQERYDQAPTGDSIPDPPQGIYSRHAIRGQARSVYQTGAASGKIPAAFWQGTWNDASVMGCADCHTVDGANTTTGNAHGSDSEYLLKNRYGLAVEGTLTDLNYNCYQCHTVGSYSGTPHTSKSSDWSDTTAGVGSSTSKGGRLSGDGNIYGFACTNCHGGILETAADPGSGRQFGTIHGTSQTMDVYGTNGTTFGKVGTRRAYRFMNGNSLRFYQPDTSATTIGGTKSTWNWAGTQSTCYTIATAGSFGGCTQHGSKSASAVLDKPVVRTLKY